MRFAPGLAVVMIALALYVSRGVLDQVLTGNGPMRVALLPPLETFVGFAAVAALGLLWLDRRTVPRGTATGVRPALGPLLLPAFGLLVLLVPYLPVVADRLPALQMLAGPVRAVIWLAIVMQLIWVLWQVRIVRADWLQQWTLTRAALGIGLATTMIAASAAARLTGTVLYPAGDEPHYLIMAQSLLGDGDLRIENNHARGDYKEYFAPDLEPHYLTRGVDGEIYSIHPVGMPVLIAPAFAIGGYRGVVVLFVLMSGAAAALMWRSVVRATTDVGATTFACAAIVATTPFLYNTFAIYPEIPAALAVAIAITLIFGGVGPREPITRWLLAGIACGVLPWLSTKYAPMSAALAIVASCRILWPAPTVTLAPEAASPRDLRRSPNLLAALLAPYVASLIAWFYFFYAFWGSPLPQAPYGALVQTDFANLVFGAPGLLFDQEYGVLSYAPVYILAATGLWIMWRDGGDMRRRALEIAVVFGALLATVGAFRIWWGGSAAPGRPLVSALLLLALPIAMAFQRAPAGSARRAAQHLLLWLSIGVTALMLLARDGHLINNGRDGTSSLLEYLSPHWPAWTMAPSFVYHEAPTALMHALAWLLIAFGAAMVIERVRTSRPGSSSTLALAIGFAAIGLAALVVPLLPASPPWPGIDVRARAQLSLLDEFDAVARPIGVEYSPLRLVSAADVPPHAVVAIEPGFPGTPQPVRLLHNGRFSLPAGRYRIEVDWSGPRRGEAIGLQIGRTGDAWRTWPIEPRAGERWSAEFDLPVTANFIGLRGSPELERTIGRISFVPLSIVDATRRPRVPMVIGASQSGTASIFYHDERVFPEPQGFWVRGARTTRATVHRATGDSPLILKVHSGLIDNRLTIACGGWTRTFDLRREADEQVEVPSTGRLVTLELSAERQFVPQETAPPSTDPRPLGVWIEVVR